MSLAYWQGDDGNEYHMRNPHTPDELDRLYLETYGITRRELNEYALDGVPRGVSVLEVGAGAGIQLAELKRMGFDRIMGIEPNAAARKLALAHNGIHLIDGNGFDLPLNDQSIDLVYTSGVLIHNPGEDCQKIMAEMERVAARWIWGFEYYSTEEQEIEYHGKQGELYSGDFVHWWMLNLPEGNWKLTRERIIPPVGNNRRSGIMYLFERTDFQNQKWLYEEPIWPKQTPEYEQKKDTEKGTLFMLGSGGSLLGNDLSLLNGVDVMCLNHSMLFAHDCNPKFWAFSHGDDREFQVYLRVARARGITSFPCWEMPQEFLNASVIQYRPALKVGWQKSIFDHGLDIAEHLGYSHIVLIGFDGNDAPERVSHIALDNAYRGGKYLESDDIIAAHPNLSFTSAGAYHGIKSIEHVSLAEALTFP